MSPLLDRFQRGQNCVFFAYGMTNSGKTHTIQGTSVDHGLLPRLVAEILDNMSGSKGWELTASVLEIYQEKIYDLIVKRTDKADRPEKLTIRDINGKVEVCKLSEHSIRTITDATKLMDIAATNR
jgi:kinesin family member 22